MVYNLTMLEILKNILVLVHLSGLSILFGGILLKLLNKVPVRSEIIFSGALIQLFSGLAIVTIVEMTKAQDLNHMKVGLKVGIALLVTFFTYLYKKNEEKLIFFNLLSLLTLLNILIAVFV